VTEDDCGTTNGVAMKALVEGGEVIEALRERILGRSVAADVVNPETQATLFEAGTLLGEDEVDQIELLGIDEVKVRTPLTCDTRYGLCARCYGRISAAAIWSTSVRRSASSPRSRSASRARS